MYIAVCMAGRSKSMASGFAAKASMRRHWLALMHPLLASPAIHVDLMLHVDNQQNTKVELITMARELRAASLTVYENTPSPHPKGLVAASVEGCLHSYAISNGAAFMRHGCAVEGHQQFWKFRGCLRELEARERARGVPYAFVIRMRCGTRDSTAPPSLAHPSV